MPRPMHNHAEEPVTTDVLIEDLKAVMRDGEALLKATEGNLGERVEEARARAQESLSGARERLHDVTGGLGTRARAAARSADDYVHENAWTAVAVAVGVGFLLGSINRRR